MKQYYKLRKLQDFQGPRNSDSRTLKHQPFSSTFNSLNTEEKNSRTFKDAWDAWDPVQVQHLVIFGKSGFSKIFGWHDLADISTANVRGLFAAKSNRTSLSLSSLSSLERLDEVSRFSVAAD